MPGLLRAATRTAVVAGTATATANAVNRRQAQRNVASYEQAQPASVGQQQPAPAATPAQPATDDKISQLERLAQLKAQGILTEAEFEQQKATILQG